jgi:hypothetical protein
VARARRKGEHVRHNRSNDGDAGQPYPQRPVRYNHQVIETARSLHRSRGGHYAQDHAQHGARRHSRRETKDKDEDDKAQSRCCTGAYASQTGAYEDARQNNQKFEPDHYRTAF